MKKTITSISFLTITLAIFGSDHSSDTQPIASRLRKRLPTSQQPTPKIRKVDNNKTKKVKILKQTPNMDLLKRGFMHLTIQCPKRFFTHSKGTIIISSMHASSSETMHT